MDDKGERVCGVVSILLCVLNGVSLLVITGGMLKVRHALANIYVNFGGSLPLPTRILMAPPDWAVVLLLSALLAVLIVKEWLMPKWKPLVFNIGWLLAGIVAVVAICVALSLPLVRMVGAAALPGSTPPPIEEAF